MARGDDDVGALVEREATGADREAVVSLVNECYRGSRGWTSEIDLVSGPRLTAEAFDRMLSPPGAARAGAVPSSALVLLVGADVGARLVACMQFKAQKSVDDGEVEGSFGLLSVSPTWQRRGVGRRLVGIAERRGREAGATRMAILALEPRTELIEWYRRLGYAPPTSADGAAPTRGPKASELIEANAGGEKVLRRDMHFSRLVKQL